MYTSEPMSDATSPALRIQNVVATVRVATVLNLDELAKRIPGAEYDKKKFPGLVLRLSSPKVAALVFTPGKIVLTGMPHPDVLPAAFSCVLEALRTAGAEIELFDPPRVVNIVSSGTFGVNPGDQGDNEDRGRDAGVLINGQSANVKGLIARIRTSGLDLVADLSTDFGTTLSSSTFRITGGGANFQIGPQVNSDGLLSIGIPSITTSNLGDSSNGFLNSLGSGGDTRITDTNNHPTAAAIVQSAIEQIATLSGRLGGFQANQVETNLNSVRVALENVQASESTIRDTDYAVEVANLTRAQILVQSTTQILGLANQLPQNVLSLLR